MWGPSPTPPPLRPNTLLGRRSSAVEVTNTSRLHERVDLTEFRSPESRPRIRIEVRRVNNKREGCKKVEMRLVFFTFTVLKKKERKKKIVSVCLPFSTSIYHISIHLRLSVCLSLSTCL